MGRKAHRGNNLPRSGVDVITNHQHQLRLRAERSRRQRDTQRQAFCSTQFGRPRLPKHETKWTRETCQLLSNELALGKCDGTRWTACRVAARESRCRLLTKQRRDLSRLISKRYESCKKHPNTKIKCQFGWDILKKGLQTLYLCALNRSSALKMATVPFPSSVAALKTRMAISPLFAARILWIFLRGPAVVVEDLRARWARPQEQILEKGHK